MFAIPPVTAAVPVAKFKMPLQVPTIVFGLFEAVYATIFASPPEIFIGPAPLVLLFPKEIFAMPPKIVEERLEVAMIKFPCAFVPVIPCVPPFMHIMPFPFPDDAILAVVLLENIVFAIPPVTAAVPELKFKMLLQVPTIVLGLFEDVCATTFAFPPEIFIALLLFPKEMFALPPKIVVEEFPVFAIIRFAFAVPVIPCAPPSVQRMPFAFPDDAIVAVVLLENIVFAIFSSNTTAVPALKFKMLLQVPLIVLVCNVEV